MPTVFGKRLDYILWAVGSVAAIAAHCYFLGLTCCAQ